MKRRSKLSHRKLVSTFKINLGGKGKSIISLENESSFLSEYTVSEGKNLVVWFFSGFFVE